MQRRQRAVLVLTAAAIWAGLTACTHDQASPGGGTHIPVDTDLLAASRTAKNAPADIQPNAGQQACGEVLLQQGKSLSSPARECFENNIGNKAARLVVAHPTTEGDPIVQYYLTSADLNGYDLITDQTRDRYSDRTWTRQRCQPATTIDSSATTCSTR